MLQCVTVSRLHLQGGVRFASSIPLLIHGRTSCCRFSKLRVSHTLKGNHAADVVVDALSGTLSFSGQPAAPHSPLSHPTYMSRTLHVPRNGTGELVATTLADVAVELASDWSAHWLRTARQAASVDRRFSWHSEERQDTIVAELLGHKRGGFHIDLAANGAVFAWLEHARA